MYCSIIVLLVILSSMEDGKFSRYQIGKELGVGGMATVYLAYDPDFDREVALKILKPELLQNTQVRDRFERETKIIARLELEAIVPVYDMGRDRENNQLFYVMRYMPGGSLSDRMQNGPISPTEIIRIIQRIAPALDEAHKRGVVHRDLKPGNILFDERNNAFISDFGIAKSVNIPMLSTLTNGSGIIGTPRYMSPEQAQAQKVDGSSDIYSLGVVVFEMLIGKTRFDTITPIGLAFRDEHAPVPHLLDTNPTLPAGIQAVMEKVLARDRNLRYATAVGFADALTAALSEPVTLPKPAEQKPPFPLRFWLGSGFTFLALILLALWGYPKLFPADTPTPEPPVATIAPSTTPTPLPQTATQMPTEPATATAIPLPALAGANKIALTSNKEIYLMNIDGSDIESLTQTQLPKFDLQWLPGGEELLYVEGDCVYRINVETARKEPEKLACFNSPDFLGFRVSPDGKQVAISITHRLLVLPFDLKILSSVSSAFELQKLEDLCLDYADVTVKGALWSADGKRLAIRYQSVVYGRIGDTIRVIQGNWERCQEVALLEWDEFPGDHFVPNGYTRFPLLPSYQWDGSQQFVVNSFIRNDNYGDLYLYDMSSGEARKINPIERACCYGSAAFSPDGTHLLLVFQDVRLGPDSVNQLYFIPTDQIGTGTDFTPLPLPRLFFQNLDENIQLALRPAVP